MSRRGSRLADLVESYFVEYLHRVRSASDHTIRAYRDGLRLFLLFLASKTGRSVANLTLRDISADTVLAFLDWIEAKRNNTASSRNHRLAVIRSFARHLLRHDIERASQYQRILSLPMKKSRLRPAAYLEPEDAKAVLRECDCRTPLGVRDRALLLFLYNTGARVSETTQLRSAQLHLRRPLQVRLFGKGGKERLCPLWSETSTALQRLAHITSDDEGFVFRNARGQPLTRDGVAYIIDKYVTRASRHRPQLRRLHVSPHVFRHSCAVGLLQAGVDVSVIRDYLGHVSIATTSRYITTNLDTKRVALDAFWRRAGLQESSTKTWRASPSLLRFLDSL